MLNKIQSHIGILSAHNRSPVTLETLINLWVDAYTDLRDLDRASAIDKVNNMEEFSIALYAFSEILGKIITDQEKNIRSIEPMFKDDILKTNQSLNEIGPVLSDIYADVEKLKEKRNSLKAKNDELSELQAKQSNLKNEIERLDKPELGELDKLRGEIENLREEHDKLEREQKCLTDEKDDLTSTRDERNTKNNALKEVVGSLNKDIKDIIAEIKRLEIEQSEGRIKYGILKQDRDALNPEQQRKRYEALLNEARPLLTSWEALRSDPLFTEVFSKTQSEEDKIHSLKVDMDSRMSNFKEETMTQWQKYGEFLAEWESILKNN